MRECKDKRTSLGRAVRQKRKACRYILHFPPTVSGDCPFRWSAWATLLGEFLTHYHKRSNVETTFHMIKSKFGQRLRSKTMTAQINEALCKVLCHNLCVVIASQHELGIETNFTNELAA